MGRGHNTRPRVTITAIRPPSPAPLAFRLEPVGRHGPAHQVFSPFRGVSAPVRPFFGSANIALIRSSSSRNSCEGVQSLDVPESDRLGRGRACGTGRGVGCCITPPIGTNPPADPSSGCRDLLVRISRRRRCSTLRRCLWPSVPQASSLSLHSERLRQRSCGFFSNFRSMPAKYPPGPLVKCPRAGSRRSPWRPRHIPGP